MKREQLYNILSEYDIKSPHISEIVDRIIKLDKPSKIKPDYVKQSVSYFNDKMKARFSHTNKTSVRLLNQLYKDGIELDTIKNVIDYKVEQWKDDDVMRKYLKPSTIFANTNFHKYVDEMENDNVLNGNHKYDNSYDEIKAYLLKDDFNSVEVSLLQKKVSDNELTISQYKELDELNKRNRLNHIKSR